LLIRRLCDADAHAYWETRNRGLKEFPEAFTTSLKEGLATNPATLAKRFGGGDSDDFVLGAIAVDGKLAGNAGFQRESRSKSRHKGTLIGMYVVPEFRGAGVGKQLLASLIEEVRQLRVIEQINLSVTHANLGARGLYLRAGFVPFGVEKNAIKVDGVYYDKEYMTLAL
jgi:RimJ/RimL family protein N-acetyltransferase